MATTKRPTSFTVDLDTLDELKTVAARKGISASRIVQEAVSQHLRGLRAGSSNGEPLCRIVPRQISPQDDPYASSIGPGDSTIEHMRYLGGGGKPTLPTERRPPRKYVVGALTLVLENRPISHQMAEKLGEDVNRALALLWVEERENGGAAR